MAAQRSAAVDFCYPTRRVLGSTPTEVPGRAV